MNETDEHPSRAESINLLPKVAILERKMRDAVIDCIEPRLPFTFIRAVEANENGDGILLLHTQPSRLGPHWVRTSRCPTIRREDRCDLLSMTEVHDMVLRNSRRFDVLQDHLTKKSREFQEFMVATIDAAIPNTIIGSSQELRRAAWSRTSGKVGYGLRVSLIPHMPLGIDRLQKVDDIFTSQSSFQRNDRTMRQQDFLWPTSGTGRRVLGGIQFDYVEQDLKWRFVADRDGMIEMVIVTIGNQGDLRVWGDWLLTACCQVMNVFDGLRRRGGSPTMPAEIEVEVRTCGPIHVEVTSGSGSGHPLDEVVKFPRYTIAEDDDVSQMANCLEADLANAGGKIVHNDPNLRWCPRPL